MPIPAELQSLLTELKISPPTKEHDEVLTVEALIALPAVADMGCSFSKNLLIKDKKVGQQGQSFLLAGPQLAPYASSGSAWRLWAVWRSQGRGWPTGRPATASGARASRLQSRRCHRL